MKISALGLIGLVFIGAACNSYAPKEQPASGQLIAGSGGPDFAMIQNKILQPYCIMCHSSAGGNAAGINVENYVNVMHYIDQIQKSVTVRQTMPPGNPLSAQMQQLLVTWVSNGAPEHVSQGTSPTASLPDTSPTSADDVQPTYASISKNIFVPKCVSCHGSSPDSVFMSYEALMKSSWVTANDLNSQLYKSVKSGMPPGQPLSQIEIDAIGTWITDGAQNN